MSTYADLINQLTALAKEAELRSTPFNRDALGETLDSLKDLARLEDRVRTAMSGLIAHDTKQGDELLAMLRESDKSDSSLTDWFSKNPKPKLVSLRFGAMANSESPLRNEEQRVLLQDLRIDSHAWYYRAHRLIKVIAEITLLKSFKCSHVTIVRNQLLEHPEGNYSGVTHASYGYDHQKGPVVKALRIGNQAGRHVDEGMYAASESLRSALHVAISKAIANLGTTHG